MARCLGGSLAAVKLLTLPPVDSFPLICEMCSWPSASGFQSIAPSKKLRHKEVDYYQLAHTYILMHTHMYIITYIHIHKYVHMTNSGFMQVLILRFRQAPGAFAETLTDM